MNQLLIIIKKIMSLLTFSLVFVVILGSLFFSQTRSNLMYVVETISMSHPITILLLLATSFWMFSDVPRLIVKFLQFRGNFKEFWKEL